MLQTSVLLVADININSIDERLWSLEIKLETFKVF